MSSFSIEDGELLHYTGHEEMVMIPEGVKGIQWGAFDQSLWWPDGTPTHRKGPWVKKLIFPSTCRWVQPRGIRLPYLKEVVLNEGLVRLSDAFVGCESLRTVHLPSTIRDMYSPFSESGVREFFFAEGTDLDRLEVDEGCFDNSELYRFTVHWPMDRACGRGGFRLYRLFDDAFWRIFVSLDAPRINPAEVEPEMRLAMLRFFAERVLNGEEAETDFREEYWSLLSPFCCGDNRLFPFTARDLAWALLKDAKGHLPQATLDAVYREYSGTADGRMADREICAMVVEAGSRDGADGLDRMFEETFGVAV